MPQQSSPLPHKVRHPGAVQYLAMWGRRITEWHENFDHKLVYAIGVAVVLTYGGELSQKTRPWAEWLEVPLKLTHSLAVIILICGVINLICRFVQNRFYPDE